MTDLLIEYAAPGAFKPYERNARTHPVEQLRQIRAAIDEFGFTNPVLVDERDRLIAGHGRQAAALLDPPLARVPYIRLAGLSDAKRRALIIADNKIALNAGWDANLLRVELMDLKAAGFDLSLTGFTDLELIGAMAVAQGRTDADDAPPAPVDPVSKLGDVWLLGVHRVVCGDSTKPEAVDAVLAGAKPHLMVTDPPYGVNYDPAWRGKALKDGAKRSEGVVHSDDRADWREAWALFPGHVAYVWHGDRHAGPVQASLEAAGFGIRAQIVWVKTRFAIGRGHYHWQHEPALYAVKDGADDNWRFVPEHELAEYAVRKGQSAEWKGGRKQSTVWNIEHIKSETGHSTQKPVECMKRPITNNSDPGQAVYDPFLGSGTTVIAAETAGRVCYGCELSPNYTDVIVRRWEAFTGKLALLEGAKRGGFVDVAKARKVKLAG